MINICMESDNSTPKWIPRKTLPPMLMKRCFKNFQVSTFIIAKLETVQKPTNNEYLNLWYTSITE